MNAFALNVENPYSYVEHGYHPLHIDSELSIEPDGPPRYRVLHKLGYGTYSTVWLAHDIRQRPPQPVALKVITADAKHSAEEVRIMRHLARNQQASAVTAKHAQHAPPSSLLGRLWALLWTGNVTASDPHCGLDPVPLPALQPPGVLPLVDEFSVVGPNGTHRCLITPVVGPSVYNLKQHFESGMLPVPLARSAAVQLVRAVATLHSAGVVHADLHVGNIALGKPAVNTLTIEELYEQLGLPKKIPPPFDEEEDAEVESEDTLDSEQDSDFDAPRFPPEYVVPPIETAKLWALSTNSCPIPLHILDFGEAWLNLAPMSPRPPSRTGIPGTPRRVAAPEILLGYSALELSAATDIWTLACTIYELFSSQPLFHMFFGDTNEVIVDIVLALGKPPTRWWSAWRSRRRWFDEDGNLTKDRASSWEGVLVTLQEKVKRARAWATQDEHPMEDYQIEDGDAEVLLRFLQRALRYEPGERPTAQELLEMLPVEWMDGRPAPSPLNTSS